MAHVMKLKAGQVSPMVGHYERVAEKTGFERANIDNDLTPLNYNLKPCNIKARLKQAQARHEELTGKAIRKDAVRLCDWVITQPQDLHDGDTQAFMKACLSFLEARYGSENIVGAYVHMDESTPHMHVPIMPIVDGKFQASKLINRQDLKTFHDDLQEHVIRELGYEVSILLDEEQKGEKQLSALSQTEYIAARQRLESLRQEERGLTKEVKELESTAETVAESAGALWKARNDGAREEGLAGEIDGLRSRISELERANQRARERVAEFDRGLPVLRGRYQQLEQRFEAVAGRVRQVIERLREVPETVSAWALDIAHKLGVRTYNPNSLERMAQQAREVSDAPSLMGHMGELSDIARGMSTSSRARARERER